MQIYLWLFYHFPFWSQHSMFNRLDHANNYCSFECKSIHWYIGYVLQHTYTCMNHIYIFSQTFHWQIQFIATRRQMIFIWRDQSEHRNPNAKMAVKVWMQLLILRHLHEHHYSWFLIHFKQKWPRFFLILKWFDTNK